LITVCGIVRFELQGTSQLLRTDARPAADALALAMIMGWERSVAEARAKRIRVSVSDRPAGCRNGVAGALVGIVMSSDARREVAHTSLAVVPDDSATGATGSL
jgi:hypothetical protein